MIRILIIEDEIVIARFIEQQLKIISPCKVEIALSIEEVEQLLPEFSPQLVLCDIELNDKLDGIELIKSLKASYSFELIFITSYQTINTINRAFELAPANYIIKPLDESRLYAGVLPVIKKISANSDTKNDIAELQKQVSQSELNILKLIAKQKTTKEIADILNLSPSTIKNHRHSICRKLNLGEETNALLTWTLKNHKLLETG
ncbi:two component transcriptional regulator, LuxR family [Pseudopedobacter saltans DSM 12145]|uniref:Two component transcriptional regulator, LuxR family n=1 Tax=Pseudopedobacter saltans (strain ATCC 51119 / DSM 12145 / JCM 21818 / CCUG 39354 / LMG 10337 / NBRC 100064 / NCIMB 13643) TaxID=762903 RepID=F0SE41_PSESL|nr:DNA-binding response regulator [Pseudopedobacter saltans]ADY52967.1 two component transcriptional regulator, LuxR family [Pseudopedobacter saltans DSM 12145]